MKRVKTTPRTPVASPSGETEGNPECDNEDAWFRRLCDELEHPSKSRREGARAALRCLNQLIRHRAAADRTAPHDTWMQLFDSCRLRIEMSADDSAVRRRRGRRVDPPAISTERKELESSEHPSQASVVQRIERSIIEREEARTIAGEAEESARVAPLLN